MSFREGGKQYCVLSTAAPPSANLKRPYVSPAALLFRPGGVEALTGEAVLGGHRGGRLYILGEGRIEIGFVAADLVMMPVQATRLDMGLAGLEPLEG